MTPTECSRLSTFFEDFLHHCGRALNCDSEVLVKEWKTTKPQTILRKLAKGEVPLTIKDPDAPKRAKSLYMIFCHVNREATKQELMKKNGTPNAITTEVTKTLGLKWNVLKNLAKDGKGKAAKEAQNELKRYENESKKDKERYQNDCKVYQKPQRTLDKTYMFFG